jgi:hypothetical protein
MYANTKKLFFWAGMKRDITQFRCKMFGMSASERQIIVTQWASYNPTTCPMSKWETISMDFITRTTSYFSKTQFHSW